MEEWSSIEEWASQEVTIGCTALDEDRDPGMDPHYWLVPADWVVQQGRYAEDLGAVALYRAVKRKQLEEVRALLAARADVMYRDEAGGWTVLHWAAYAFHSDDQHELIHALCQAPDVDVDAQNKSGTTPLRCIAGFPPMPNNVRALLACRADPTVADNGGMTALEAAEGECGPTPPTDDIGRRCREVADMLRAACEATP
mmetsp:Transcript_37064/g.115374  ORF Transcript_37064/g.115374 Transcript_37064/m.115374 type:complete len:199 (+) Transcript_37064:44-640(+)